MSDWRERTRHAEPPPRSVARVVGRTALSLRATRAVESGLFLVAAALCVRAAAEWQRCPEAARGQVWALAGIAGLCAALAWWREHPVSGARVARELDRRLRHHGGLVTAWELERRPAGPASDMERLVTRRVLERLRPGEALRALLPPLFVPVAAPVAAALVLLLALEARPPADAGDFDPARLAAGLEGALERAGAALEGAAAAGGLDPGQAREGSRLLAEARRGARAGAADPGRRAADLAALDELLVRLEEGLEVRRAQARSAAGTERALEGAALREARAWLDALRRGGPGAPGEPGAQGGTGPGMAPDALAPGSGNGIMSGSPAGSESPPAPSVSTPSPLVPDPTASSAQPSDLPPGAGLFSGAGGTRWWPAAQDGLVQAWLERSRAAARDE